ncbi:transglutaminaseTgpA domain-containing protein [Marinobacterium sediminicola]|uniref:Transglutaminase-like superfamily protein n=1 Tax=Marinobacterium sediminicola TaxID=518898 RepID=A0ABY1RXB0_9GAMM|nr:DUF3488 and transglutaminase-like domain-containing protein [Marinobacterium sediminicola]ULG67943.1 DUF3488 and transglutaminase-like domain-containing protein [Marinobacterium sediminicola]SMR71323.1 Transglutaminase-like superfamily protein [Marinobacterium sediminicola]
MKGGLISRTAVGWQLLVVLLSVLPHMEWLPLWVPALVVSTAGARLMIHSGRWSFPHWSVKTALVIAACMGLILSFNQTAGPETMVALLVVGQALKLLEIYHRRDALVVLFVTLFVTATTFLFNETVWMAAYVFLVVTLVLAAMNSIQQSDHNNLYADHLRNAVRLLFPAIPFMLVLFFLFPRLEPFWSVTLDTGQAQTGLSDELSPGDVSKLAQSSALAFRASFSGPVPPPEQRYWRMLVLSEFDGRRWTRPALQVRRQLRTEKLYPLVEGQNYEVIMEASGRPWLPALDQPMKAEAGFFMTPVRTLRASQAVDRRLQYRLQSVPLYRLQPLLTAQEEQRYLQLPARGNSDSRELARQLVADSGGDTSRVIRQLMELFNREFIYTLEPGRLGRDSVDQFLFEAKQGYCEHFASATVFVLRSAGIPARVVTGYQGGEWNPYEGYLQVRQYDAHAWVEYWTPGSGWQRLDPTAAVAPERIRSSAQEYFRAYENRFAGAVSRLGAGWLRDLAQRYDAFNYAWHRWVLNYEGQQADLLRDWLGGGEQWRQVLAWIVPSAMVFGGLAWYLMRPRRASPRDPLERVLQRLQQRLSVLGNERLPAESLSMWLRRSADDWPRQKGMLLKLALLDDRLRYAEQADPEQRGEMIHLSRQLLRELPRGKRHES